jgi:glycerophosphoryl diester phosphodiesterase
MNRFLLRKICFLFLSILVIQCSKPKLENEVPSPVELKASFTSTVNQTTVSSTIQFAGTATIADNSINTWTWDFADGTPLVTTKNVAHQFALAGSYLVTLTVISKTGQSTSYSKRLLVRNVIAPDYGNLIGLKEKLLLLYPKVVVAAHRAFHKNYPENSLEAIHDAAVNKINLVEIDVRLTLDKELVLMHDATTTRTTNASFSVAQKTASELKQLKLLFNGVATNYTIPRLKEALVKAKGNVYVDIDASWDNSVFYYNKIYNIVAALNMVNMVMIYTESAQVAKGLLEIDPEIIVLLGSGNASDYNNASIMNPKASVWHLSSATLSPNYTNWPVNNGIKLWANAYVNSTSIPPVSGNDAIVDNLVNNQVSFIQTDYPKEIVSYLLTRNLWLQ